MKHPTAPAPEVERVARLLFESDWPNDKWENHFAKDAKTKQVLWDRPDAAARRYLMLAQTAIAALSRPQVAQPDTVAVEQAGRAIYDETWPPLMGAKPTWEELSESNQNRYRAYARAALRTYAATLAAGGK